MHEHGAFLSPAAMDAFADGVFYLKLGQVFVAIVCLVSGFVCCLCGWGLCSRTRRKFKRTQLVSPQHEYGIRLEVRKQVLVEEGLAAHRVSAAAFKAKSKALAASRARREAAQARKLRELKARNDYELQAVDDACVIDEKGDLMLPDMEEVHPDQVAALQLVDV